MFAVPGWNLSAAPKAEQPGAKPNSNNSKKRKRKEGKQGGAKQVNSDNVGDMWAQVLEGAPGPAPVTGSNAQKVGGKEKGEKKDKGEKQKNKKQRRESDGAEAVKGDGKAEEKVEDSKKGDRKGKPEKGAKKDKHGKKQQKHHDAEPAVEATAPAPVIPAVAPPLPPANTKLTPLQAKMREKLIGARFRHLNQTLYTTPSQHSLKLIEDDPQIFAEYHAGFRQQVRDWPENPVDTFVSLVLARGAVRENWRDKILKRKEKEAQKQHTSGRYRQAGQRPEDDEDPDSEEEEKKRAAAAAVVKPLPRTRGTSIIADLGCGDAALATRLQPHLHSLNMRVHSFDLAAPSPLITKADIANLPLDDGSVDVAVFCLALMGTNWLDFVDEAWRVLHWKGELWVAEIKSRFGRVSNAKRPGDAVAHSVGKRQKKKVEAARKKSGADKKDKEAAAAEEEQELAVEVDGAATNRQETDVSAFVDVLRKRGFVLDAEPGREKDAVDLKNKMFVRMSFVKAVAPVKGKNVKANEKIYAEKAAQLAQESGKTFKKKDMKPKFLDANEDEIDETAVLKPCLYKQR
ncbi:Methyltransferase-related protein [Neofusicoccum parvum]|uniref:Ribosomal RNA-processing protein 8 n=1 Tax=Botryosphaeria parva (strain UCR-NP2) TaxID=1287680 RepID=R1ETK2_BOTPV|nr:putative ribosomal rna-processing protein 8 protein [Neofusicoccum parvum UCRNP2]GME59215.1 Methyltransferase-related protein [Neofusicoccum parvum]